MIKRCTCLINDNIFTDTNEFNMTFKQLWYNTCSEEFQKSGQGQLCGAWRYNYQPLTRLASLKVGAVNGAAPTVSTYDTSVALDPNGYQPLMFGVDIKNHQD